MENARHHEDDPPLLFVNATGASSIPKTGVILAVPAKQWLFSLTQKYQHRLPVSNVPQIGNCDGSNGTSTAAHTSGNGISTAAHSSSNSNIISGNNNNNDSSNSNDGESSSDVSSNGNASPLKSHKENGATKKSVEIISFSDIPNDEINNLLEFGVTHLLLLNPWTESQPSIATRSLSHFSFQERIPGLLKDDIIGNTLCLYDHKFHPNWIRSVTEIIEFRERLRKKSIKLLFDYTANHRSADSRLYKTHRDLFFVDPKTGKVETGKIESHSQFISIHGTAQLNFSFEKTHKVLQEEILRIVSVADGLLSHSPHLQLPQVFSKNWSHLLDYQQSIKPISLSNKNTTSVHGEPATEDQLNFWSSTIKLVKQRYPSFLFIAGEAPPEYTQELYATGFDLVLDSELKQLLNKTSLDPHNNPQELHDFIRSTPARDHHRKCKYLFHFEHILSPQFRRSSQTSLLLLKEDLLNLPLQRQPREIIDPNHPQEIDGRPQHLPREIIGSILQSPREIFLSRKISHAASVFSFSLPGWRMVTLPHLCGLRGPILESRKQLPEQADQTEKRALKIIFELFQRPLLRMGSWEPLFCLDQDHDSSIFAWRWDWNFQRLFVACNFSANFASSSFILSNAEPTKKGEDTLVIHDLINDSFFMRSSSKLRKSGIHITLEPWETKILEY